MKRWFGSAHRIDKRLRHFPWRIDCCFKNQESARDQKELLQRQHQVLAVVNQTERQRDIELAQFAWVDIVNRHALVSDIKSQNFLNKISLANEFTLRVDSEHPFRTTPFHFDGIEARVAADIENALSGKIIREMNSYFFPGWSRMVDRFSDSALGFGAQSIAEVHAMKPRFEPPDF